MNQDKIKQQQMKSYYNNTFYESIPHSFADRETRFNQYMVKNVLSIYYPKKHEKIIDLGCGWGNISLALQKRGFSVLGIDYSEDSINLCKKTAEKLDLDSSRFICRDATDTGLKSNSFDVVYCADLVEHLYPAVYDELLIEVYRLLKKGGEFVIYTPNPSHLFEIMKKHNIILKKVVSHVDYKTMKRLKSSLTDNRFTVKKAFYCESHVPILDLIERLTLKFFPLFRRRNAVLAIKN